MVRSHLDYMHHPISKAIFTPVKHGTAFLESYIIVSSSYVYYCSNFIEGWCDSFIIYL